MSVDIAVREMEPDRSADDAEYVGTIYSNFDHAFNDDVVRLVRETSGGVGQHAAWDFCGYIAFGDGVWIETVWCYHIPIARYAHPDLMTLISHVNAKHGDD